MPLQNTTPIPYAYWVRPGRLLAGEHPGSPDLEQSRQTIRRLLAAQVRVFIDLTEDNEWEPYTDVAQAEAAATDQTITCCHIPIPDQHVPSIAQMHSILDIIDAALAAEQTVYVHCLAGIGRTGTVIGCHLVRSGLSGMAALQEIAYRRRGMPGEFIPSPETPEQEQFVLTWQAYY